MTDYVGSLRELVGTRRLLVPGVRAVIANESGEVLLQRRTDIPFWGLPAGSVDIGETVLDTLRREVAEETSLTVVEAEPMALYSGPSQRFTYPNGDQVEGFVLAFIVRRWEGEPAACGVEGSELRFFGLDALPDDMLPMHRQTLEDYRRYGGTFLMAC